MKVRGLVRSQSDLSFVSRNHNTMQQQEDENQDQSWCFTVATTAESPASRGVRLTSKESLEIGLGK